MRRGCRRRHAESSVIVDLRRAQSDTREFAQQVRLLVGETSASEDSDRVPAVLLLCAFDPRQGAIQGFLPAGWAQGFPLGTVANQRLQEAVRTSQQLRRRSSLFGTGRRGWWENRDPSRSTVHRISASRFIPHCSAQ